MLNHLTIEYVSRLFHSQTYSFAFFSQLWKKYDIDRSGCIDSSEFSVRELLKSFINSFSSFRMGVPHDWKIISNLLFYLSP